MTLLKLLVAEHFDGVIWRLEIDSLSNTLFIETRKPDDRQVNFSALDMNSGKTLFKNKAIDESWLTGVEAGFDGVLLLHYYQNAGSPAHKGLAAIEATTGNLLWHNFNYTFDHLTSNGPVVFDSRFQPSQYYIVNIKTGQQLRPFDKAADQPLNNHIISPDLLTKPDMLPALPVEPYGNIHYLEYNKFRIVSLHALWAGQLRQYLFVIDNGQVIFEDILNTNIQKLQPEAFVLYRNRLIYIKDKSEIKVLDL